MLNFNYMRGKFDSKDFSDKRLINCNFQQTKIHIFLKPYIPNCSGESPLLNDIPHFALNIQKHAKITPKKTTHKKPYKPRLKKSPLYNSLLLQFKTPNSKGPKGNSKLIISRDSRTNHNRCRLSPKGNNKPPAHKIIRK
jgi:hypothetical protein